jgi:hypothetical protein
MAYSWMKLHCSLLDNSKTGLLPDHLWRKYIELNLIAKEFDRNGQLPSAEEMAWRLRITPNQCNETLQELEKYALVKLYCNEALQNDTKTYILPDFLTSQEPEPVEKRVSEHRQRTKADPKQVKIGSKTPKCNDSLHRQTDKQTIVVVGDDDENNQFKKDLWSLKKINYQSVKDLLPKADLVHRWAEVAELIPADWGTGLIVTMLRAGDEPLFAQEPEQEPIINIPERQTITPAQQLWSEIKSTLSHRPILNRFTAIDLNGALILSGEKGYIAQAKRMLTELNRTADSIIAGVTVEFIEQ